MSQKLIIDEKSYSVDVDDNTPLLWVLRDHLGLKGTKFGCGVGQCGACTVLKDGEAIRSCSVSLKNIGDSKITTIQNTENKTIKKLQKFWIQEDVAQCGYCQPGQIMNATALLNKNTNPNDEEILKAMNGNICRCGTYNKIKTAIKIAAKEV